MVRNGGVSVRLKKSFSLVLSLTQVFRESGCLIKLTIHATLLYLHVILARIANITLYSDLVLDLSVPLLLPNNRNNFL